MAQQSTHKRLIDNPAFLEGFAEQCKASGLNEQGVVDAFRLLEAQSGYLTDTPVFRKQEAADDHAR
jgi:hypothetical protein